jgi:hypothetical protein
MVRVSRRTPPAHDAAKARAIVEQGGSVHFVGDPRHLRKIHAGLVGTPGLATFLGDADESTVVLVVSPDGDDRGSLLVDRLHELGG